MLQEILAIAIIVLGFSLAIAVWLSNTKASSITQLSYLVFVIVINFLNLLLIKQEVLPPLLNFFGVYALLYGMLLREYRAKLENKPSSPRQSFVIAALLVIGAMAVVIIQASQGAKFILFETDDLETIPGLILIAINSFLGIGKYFRQRKQFPIQALLFTSSAILSVLLILEFLISASGTGDLYVIITSSIFLITYLLISILIIHGLMQTKSNQFANQVKYTTSALDKGDLELIADRIKTCFSDEMPYLKSDFTLDDLSQKTGIQKTKISQALNTHFDKSFYEFVNEKRTAAAIGMIKEDPNQELSIKQIMYNSGFSSKSTFVKYFKSATGLTPTEYRSKNRFD